MLRHEEAEKRLEKVKIKNWEEKVLAALGKLPAKLAEIGRGLLRRDARGKAIRDWQKSYKVQEVSYEALGKLSGKDRQRIFAVFFPKIARELEAGWQLLARLPYEVDYERKGFRAPNDPTVHQQLRKEWLGNILSELEGFDQDLLWFAAWAPHLCYGSGADSVGILLAAALDAGGPEGEQLFELLKESAANQHEIGRMGRHVSRALLVCSRPEAWEYMEKLLLAAQRQEGLRQVILESIDEAHPQAFKRMLALILDENLIRFSSVVRAVDVWFGLQWDALTPAKIKETLETVRRFLEDRDARNEALRNATGETLFLALWTLAFEDANAAVKPAATLLKDPNVERRYLAVHFLSMLDLEAARKELPVCLGDEDLRVALHALEHCPEGLDLFEPLKQLLERMPAKRTDLPPLVWPWAQETADRSDVADKLVESIGKRPPTVLIPYVQSMGYSGKVWLINKLVHGKKEIDAAARDLLLNLVGDRDSYVREQALRALKKGTVEEQDALRLEPLLARKGEDLRRGVLGLLVKQKVEAALASADRLLASRKAEPRLAGLELLRLLVDKKRGVPAARERAEKYRTEHTDLTEHEGLQVDAILDIHRVVPVLDDAFGLMKPDERTPVVPPQQRKAAFVTPAACALLKSLDELIEENGEERLTIKTWEGMSEELLGNLDYGFPVPDWTRPLEKDKPRLPLLELWEKWWQERPKNTRDKDGLELLRAAVWLQVDKDDLKRWQAFGKRSPGMKAAVQALTGGQDAVKVRHGGIIVDLLDWFQRLHPLEGAVDFLLDVVETSFALVPETELKRELNPKNKEEEWRELGPFEKWFDALEEAWNRSHETWKKEQVVRCWQLQHWRDQPVPGVTRKRPDLDVLLAAYEAGAANQHDFLDEILGPRGHLQYYSDNFHSLRHLTAPHPPEVLQRRPELKQLVERCRERLLEIELARGELPTNATEPIRYLGSLHGLDTLVRLLQVLDGKAFDRKSGEFSESKGTVLSRLIRVTHPLPTDTAEAFADQMKALLKKKLLTPDRLLELAFLAPQWLDHVQAFLGWDGLKEGVWWFLAHTPSGRHGDDFDEDDYDDDDEDEVFDDADDSVGEKPAEAKREKEDPWSKLLRERTPLTQHEMNQGAVDVSWFARTYPVVGPKRWLQLAQASKYGCTNNSFKKAVLLGEVLRGKANKRQLVEGVKIRRLKESVRLLGLLPLPAGEKRDDELLTRYKVLQEYRRYARSLSPLSREDSVRTAEIGLQNLARTGGYPDPIRLEWAMEAREIGDLARGPISATHQGVTVTLALDEQAQAVLTVQRGDRVLKSIPSTVRQHPKIAYLAERKADLKRQASRMRQSLETAMCRGDTFVGSELKKLFEHPVLVPLLQRLVLLGEGIRGYPVAGGQGLSDYNDKVEPIKPDEKLRIAHPHDLLTAGDWPEWQKHCFATERVQPFKQVFRELYVVTEQEKSDRTVSHRYTGHQVNPNQATALFGSRGWSARDEVTKTFYDLGITAEVTFRSGMFTPLEVEGLTLEDVRFTRRGDWQPMPLVDVPPRVFSEVMRDCDLVVSVAHVGGVDPEASASTVDMRAALLRETCSLLKIDNYRVQGPHALIDGQLGKYSVHLGSAIVHRQPGGSLCIVPVHAQHRGRLFLPFADDDPRTAEVVSKVILLARDHEIQDPNILDQLRS